MHSILSEKRLPLCSSAQLSQTVPACVLLQPFTGMSGARERNHRTIRGQSRGDNEGQKLNVGIEGNRNYARQMQSISKMPKSSKKDTNAVINHIQIKRRLFTVFAQFPRKLVILTAI
jgi:hypothetical protein